MGHHLFTTDGHTHTHTRKIPQHLKAARREDLRAPSWRSVHASFIAVRRAASAVGDDTRDGGSEEPVEGLTEAQQNSF